jgi:hypothetical protein
LAVAAVAGIFVSFKMAGRRGETRRRLEVVDDEMDREEPRRPSRPAIVVPQLAAPPTAPVQAVSAPTSDELQQGLENPSESARRRAEIAVRELEASGPATPSFSARAATTFDAWKRTSPIGDRVKLSPMRCFDRGCAVVATHEDANAASTATQDFIRSQPFREWTGPKFVSGPTELSSGRIETVLILYRENE